MMDNNAGTAQHFTADPGGRPSPLLPFLHHQRSYVDGLHAACLVKRRLALKDLPVLPILDLLEPHERLHDLHKRLLDRLEESDGLSVFDARFERLLCNAYMLHLQAHEAHFDMARETLNNDGVLRHIVLTECKLASGEWIDILGLASLPLTSLEGSRTDLGELLGVTDRGQTRHYMSVANALAVINRVLHRLEQWRMQRGLFDGLRGRVRGLEGDACGRDQRGRRPLRTLSVSQVNARRVFHEGSSAFNLLEIEQEGVPRNVVYASEMVRIGWWHRLLILVPDSILICRVVGIWSLLRTLFSGAYEPREYAVIGSVPLKRGLSVHSEDGLTWHLHDRLVVFRGREECGRFLTALQEAVLAA